MNNNVYLKLENVKKSLANFELDNVSFSLPKDYIMGLIGSNGAGKTTTIIVKCIKLFIQLSASGAF